MILSFHWTPRIVPPGDGETLSYPASALWVVAGLGAGLVVAGLRLRLDRQYHNGLLVGTRAGLLTLGTSFAARERVVITPDELAVRRWWAFQSHSWRYDDLQSITVVSHHRRKGRRWITLRVEVRDEGRAIEEVGVPLMIDAARLTLLTHARA